MIGLSRPVPAHPHSVCLRPLPHQLVGRSLLSLDDLSSEPFWFVLCSPLHYPDLRHAQPDGRLCHGVRPQFPGAPGELARHQARPGPGERPPARPPGVPAQQQLSEPQQRGLYRQLSDPSPRCQDCFWGFQKIVLVSGINRAIGVGLAKERWRGGCRKLTERVSGLLAEILKKCVNTVSTFLLCQFLCCVILRFLLMIGRAI